MNFARNYENVLNFVKVVPKILSVPFFLDPSTPRPCNQLGSDLDCWEATDLEQWMEEAGPLFHVHGVPEKSRLLATTAIISRLVPGVNAFLESKK